MRSFCRRLVAVLSAFLIFVSNFTFPVYADAPTWCKVYVLQGGVCHPAGCTVVTLQLILQNSATLTGTWQLNGAIKSRSFRDGSPYDKFDIECAKTSSQEGISDGILSNKTSDSVISSGFVPLSRRVCNSDVTWERVASGTSVDGQVIHNSGTGVITGLGNKDFKNMSNAEVIASMKAFWNAGVWCAVAVEYKGGTKAPTNGPDGYKGNHWVMLSGIDDSDVYFNDPATGGTTRLSTAKSYGGNYHIVYIVPFRNNKTTPASVAGGNVQFSQTDYSNLAGMGVDNTVVNGLGSSSGQVSLTFSDALFSSSRLTEANLEDFLEATTVENLGQDDLEMLEGWKTNIEADKNEWGFIAVLRWLVSLLGILITLWAVLVYLAFWFDHINSFVYLDLLHIITLGALHICPPNEKPTFSLGKDVKNKTVSHFQILGICITALLFGASLISGVFYKAVATLVNFIWEFIHG